MVSGKRLGLSGLVAAAALVFAQPAYSQTSEPEIQRTYRGLEFDNGIFKMKGDLLLARVNTDFGTIFCYHELGKDRMKNYLTTLNVGLDYLENSLEILARTDTVISQDSVELVDLKSSRWIYENIPPSPIIFVYDTDTDWKGLDVPPLVGFINSDSIPNGRSFPELLREKCGEFYKGLSSQIESKHN